MRCVCRSQIVVLKEEGYAEWQTSQQINVSKIAVHNYTVKHEIDGIFTEIDPSGWSSAPIFQDDHIIRRILRIHLGVPVKK